MRWMMWKSWAVSCQFVRPAKKSVTIKVIGIRSRCTSGIIQRQNSVTASVKNAVISCMVLMSGTKKTENRCNNTIPKWFDQHQLIWMSSDFIWMSSDFIWMSSDFIRQHFDYSVRSMLFCRFPIISSPNIQGVSSGFYSQKKSWSTSSDHLLMGLLTVFQHR